jgi:hypothetical protein
MAVQNKDVYGVVASMLGVDALDAADQDLILSSSSPLLKIDKEFTITLTLDGLTVQTLATHNYGYPCFFLVYVISGGVLMNEFITNLIVDNNTVKIDTPKTGTFTFRIITCRNPLNKALTTPVFSTQSRESALRDRNYGLIVAKNGKSTDSTDYRDFTFHSDTRNLLVHKVDYREFGNGYPDGLGGTMSGYGMYTQNDLPYRPVYYVFVSLDNGASYRMLWGGEQAVPGTRQVADGSIRTDGFWDGTNKQYGSIWMFKDPMQPAVTTTVTI